MKRCVLLLFLFVSFLGYAQNTINNYKYVIVPEKFSFLKENDQYSLNSITRLLLENKGFKALFDTAQMPDELANNNCNALTVDLLNKSGMFSTSLILVLKDCHGNILFTSKTGKSREKEFGASYNQALRDAFTSLDQVPYKYSGPANLAVATTPIVTPIAAVTTSPKAVEAGNSNSPGTLYAQPISNGFQLVDTTPKKVLTLLKTSEANHFIANNDTFNGIVLKVNEDWYFEYYNNGKLITEKLQVKF